VDTGFRRYDEAGVGQQENSNQFLNLILKRPLALLKTMIAAAYCGRRISGRLQWRTRSKSAQREKPKSQSRKRRAQQRNLCSRQRPCKVLHCARSNLPLRRWRLQRHRPAAEIVHRAERLIVNALVLGKRLIASWPGRPQRHRCLTGRQRDLGDIDRSWLRCPAEQRTIA
jgi:hypothetical protein